MRITMQRIYQEIRMIQKNISVLPLCQKIQLTPSCYNQVRGKSWKKHLDYSKFPKINEKEIEIQQVRGSGPGGQATNKTNNAVVLKHTPTGIVVKCHQTRSMWENKKRAQEILLAKLDNLLNGEDSIENQIRRLEEKRRADKKRKQQKLQELKAAFKEREGLT